MHWRWIKKPNMKKLNNKRPLVITTPITPSEVLMISRSCSWDCQMRMDCLFLILQN